ncbi:hypothetical protein FRC02_005846 [Tulasnella sp. 418]|nr:hypothetical protein FRC02_005846 [Tulasnella sp. 418]
MTSAQGTAKNRKRAEENEGRDSTKLGSPQVHHCHGVVNLAEHVRNFWELVQNHASSSEYSRWASSLQAEIGAPGATIDTGDLAQEHFFTNCMTPILDKGFSEGDMDEEDRVNSII